MPAGFYFVIAAQFVSALADNALLIISIARLIELGEPGWWAPLLKFWFTISYVLLAPWVGPLADAVPKARLMAWMNGVKFIGAGLLLAGAQPLLAFAIVGLAAATYAPAKYGIITEMVTAQRLVAANAWIEVSIVCAVLLGTVVGGLLVSPWFLGLSMTSAAQQTLSWLRPDLTSLALPLAFVLALYALAAVLNFGIPNNRKSYATAWSNRKGALHGFLLANQLLWRDREGGLSLSVTTLFWGAGATLQFLVLRWAQEALDLQLNQAAYLQGVVAVGVLLGAALAGRWIRLSGATKVLPLGVAMGLLVPFMGAVGSMPVAVVLLALIGACAGFFVVPMNALLQHRGYRLTTPGRSIAVQGFNENLSVLLMLATYSALVAAEVSTSVLLWLLGLAVALPTAALILRERHPQLRPQVQRRSISADTRSPHPPRSR